MEKHQRRAVPYFHRSTQSLVQRGSFEVLPARLSPRLLRFNTIKLLIHLDKIEAVVLLKRRKPRNNLEILREGCALWDCNGQLADIWQHFLQAGPSG